jgi:plastocyanin
MRRISVSAVVALLSGCGLGGPAHDHPPPGVAATVDMTDFLGFDPSEITIHQGDTVEWRNTALFHHTVTDDPGKAAHTNGMVLPTGAEGFDSGNIPAGDVYLHKFTVAGTYRYVCLYHEDEGMKGAVIVLPRR